jgi:RHS repeat-associated protein
MKYFLSILLLTITAGVMCQVTPPTPYISGAKLSYVRTWDAAMPISRYDSIKTTDVLQARQSTQYVDGFGRTLQMVQRKITPGQKDMVLTQVYDAYGRETYKYLPYESVTTAAGTDVINDGNFKINAFEQQKQFAQAQYPGESYYYSQTNYEASPLNRVQESFAAGNNWAGTANLSVANHHSLRTQYLTNTAGDSVRAWQVSENGIFSGTTMYSRGQLFKNVTFDEHGKQAVEFKDKEDRVLLKRVQINNTVSDGHAGWLCTYYVYDRYGNLRLVIPPRAVELVAANSWNLAYDVNLINELCFRYEYDSRNRQIIKKVPGAGPVSMVYDNLDRLVMTQDSGLKVKGKWLVTQFDYLQRPLRTGLWTSSSDRATHQAAANSQPVYPAASNLDPATNYEVLSETYYDSYGWVGGTGLSSTLDNSNTSNSTYFFTSYNTAPAYAQSITATNTTRGFVTGKKVKVMGTAAQYLYTVNFYDDKGRLLQTQHTNSTGGKDIITSQYDWSGKVLRTLTQQQNTAGVNQQHLLLTKMEYDHAGRLLKIKKMMSSDIKGTVYTTAEKTIVTNEYDNIGQLKSKTVGDGSAGVNEKLMQEYNIRGWITGVNKEYIKDSINAHWFGYELGYDRTTSAINGTSFGTPQFNGNISGAIWKSGGDQEKRKFDFSYDNANRLLAGTFKQKFGSSWANTDPGNSNFSVDFSLDSMRYDANGNILRIRQKGLKVTASSVIDDLSYVYAAGGVSNKLLSVTEGGGIGATENKLGDFTDRNTGADDYAYDANGNLKYDKNKRIDSIYYNHLNMPYRIRVNDNIGALKGIVEYTYDAEGNKLSKRVTEGSIVTKTDYIAGFVYQNDTLQFAGHEEGRIRFKPLPGSLYFDYFLKDHLGNIRVVLTEEKQVDHYPTVTLEGSGSGSPVQMEQLYYDFNTGYVQTKTTSPAYQNNNGISNPATFGNPNANSQKMYRLNANTNKTGLSIVLRVMAGDTLNILGKSYYVGGGEANNSPLTASAIIASFLGVAGGANPAVLHGATSPIMNGNTAGTVTPLSIFTNNNPVNPSNNVKAAINYILFDDHFNYVTAGFDGVNSGAAGGIKSHFIQNIKAAKNGYMYIYCSNESNVDVFFDNLEVIHSRGPLIEENTYYPYGLKMAGISANSAGSMENRWKFNGKELQSKEFADASGLDLEDYGARMFDAQIGRWMCPDPKADAYYQLSPYHYTACSPVNAIEVDGRLFIFANGFMKDHWVKGENKWTGRERNNYPRFDIYAPDRGFYKTGPRNNGQTFTYWQDIDKGYINTYGSLDEKAYYTNGSFTPEATAEARMNEGRKAGRHLVEMLESGEIVLKEGETIKIVGHSQGAAYAAGIAQALVESKYGSLIEFVDYLSPHQPGNIKHPAAVKGRQFSTESDQVSSTGLMAWAFGRSKLAKIQGVPYSNYHLRKSYKGGFSGHLVETWSVYLAILWVQDQTSKLKSK